MAFIRNIMLLTGLTLILAVPFLLLTALILGTISDRVRGFVWHLLGIAAYSLWLFWGFVTVFMNISDRFAWEGGLWLVIPAVPYTVIAIMAKKNGSRLRFWTGIAGAMAIVCLPVGFILVAVQSVF